MERREADRIRAPPRTLAQDSGVCRARKSPLTLSLDTSSLVSSTPKKLAPTTCAAWWLVATSMVAYAETRAALRGFDALHLASFAHIARRAGVPDTRFSSFDDPLNKAARDVSRRLSAAL